MKISSIKKQKNGKYKLSLDDNSSITTYDKVILDNNLLFNPNLDIEVLTKINEENNYYNIYNKLIKMIGIKLRSEKEIYDFLIKSNIKESDINSIILNLKNSNLINDRNFTKAFIHDKINFSNDGPSKIKKSLLDYGIEVNLINEEFENLDNNIFLEKMKKIISKKITKNNKYSKNQLKSKIKNELIILGYSLDGIDDNYFDIDDYEILEKEIFKVYNKLSKKYQNEELKYNLCGKLIQKGFSKDKIIKCLEKNGIY